MNKLRFLLLLACIIPVFAYEVYTPEDYSYRQSWDKLLFVVDFSNSMGEFGQSDDGRSFTADFS